MQIIQNLDQIWSVAKIYQKSVSSRFFLAFEKYYSVITKQVFSNAKESFKNDDWC